MMPLIHSVDHPFLSRSARARPAIAWQTDLALHRQERTIAANSFLDNDPDMTEPRRRNLLPLPCLLLLASGFSIIAGCSGHQTPVNGYPCYAKALPTTGVGGLAWGPNVKTASVKSLDNCRRYAAESGGTPGTCKVTVASCR